MTQMIDIGALADIPPRGARKIRTASGCVAVFRTAGDEVFALDDRCPHKAGPLSDGIVHGRSVTDEGATRTIPCRIEAGRILVDAEALGLAPAADFEPARGAA